MLKFGGSVFGVLLVLSLFAQSDSVKTFLPDTFQYNNPEHFVQLASKLTHERKLNEAQWLIELGIETFNRNKDQHTWALLNYFLADCYYYQQKYDKAEEIYYLILPLFEKACDSLFIGRVYNSIGILCNFKQDYDNALKNYLAGLNLLNEIPFPNYDIKRQRLIVLINIINQAFRSKDDDIVIEYAPIVINIAIELGDSSHLASVLNTLGITYKNRNDFEKSLSTYQRASRIYKSLGDEFRNAFVFNNIGSLYDCNGESDSALFYYDSALSCFENEDHQRGIANTEIGIAYVLEKQGEYKKTKMLYEESIAISTQYKFNNILLKAYKGIAELEYDYKNYQNAYKYNELYYALKDSVFTIKKEKQYAELKTKFLTTQKENEINLLKNERLTQEFKLKQYQFEKRIGLVLIIILAFIVYVIFLFYRGKKRANDLLIEKNQQIEEHNQKLTELNEHISDINQKLKISGDELEKADNAKNRFFSILAHDLRNPFHNIIGLSYLLSQQYDHLSHDERIKYANDIHQSGNLTKRLLENLLEWSRTQTNGIVFCPVKVDVKKIIDDTVAVLLMNAKVKSIEIKNNVINPIVITADPAMLETIFRNLINNSIKYTPEGGIIIVSSELKGQHLYTSIEDTGVGIEMKNLSKLFDIDSNLKTKGTNDEKGTGLGLVLCKEFIDYHEGKIWVDSKLGIGSKFQFEIPVTIVC